MIRKWDEWDGKETNVVIHGAMEHVVQKMVASELKADLTVTSPPYGVGEILSVPSMIRSKQTNEKPEGYVYDSVTDKFDESDYERWLGLCQYVSHLTFWNVPAKQFETSFGVYPEKAAAQIIWAKPQTVPFAKRGVIYLHEYIWVFGDHTRIHKPLKSVWTMHTQRFSKHPAPFPVDLPSKAIAHATLPGGLVFDPFCGSGTTAAVAKALGRRFITCDVSEEYCKWAAERIEKTSVL